MPDLAGDGKLDWYDDYMINEIIPDMEKNSGSTDSHHSSAIGCTLPAIIIFAVLREIINLLAELLN